MGLLPYRQGRPRLSSLILVLPKPKSLFRILNVLTYHGSDPRWLVEYLLCRGERKLFHGCRLGTKYRWGARILPGLSPNSKTNLGWYRDSTPPLNRYSASNSAKKYPLKSSDHTCV